MGSRPLRVMIVDDDKNVIEMFKDVFGKVIQGDVVSAALDGDDAVAKYRALKPGPDIVLMDERMPRMSGIDATKMILEMDASARIVFVSADSTIEQRALRAGARGVIQKPFRLDDLRSCIDKAMEDLAE